MKVIVFGATGSIGKLAVIRMLQQGHQVSAFSRNPEKLGIDDASLTLLSGDASDPRAVSDAVAGHDAVVITIGAGMSRSSKIRSESTLNVIRAMQATGVRRLICQSTLGANDSRGNLNFYWKRIMFGLLLRPVYLDHELQEQLVQASGLDWTIVRPSAFTDKPATGTFKEAFSGSERTLKLTIPRADIANFIARQLADATYMKRAVGISH